jgi:hypothetical protein
MELNPIQIQLSVSSLNKQQMIVKQNTLWWCFLFVICMQDFRFVIYNVALNKLPTSTWLGSLLMGQFPSPTILVGILVIL